MKLGIKRKDGPEVYKPDKVRYPNLDLEDDAARQFVADHSPKMGQEMEARVKLKVRHMSVGDSHARVGFDVTELHPPAKGKAKPAAPTKGDVAGMLKSAMMADSD